MTAISTYSGFTRKCIACGKPYESLNVRQLKCKKACGVSHHKYDVYKPPEFIGVDGEGVTDGKSHAYVLISVGDKSYHRDGARLEHGEIFEFLYQCFLEKPDAVFVGYFLGYDFTQWVRDITEHEARSLLLAEGIAKRARIKSGGNPKPFPVYLGDFDWEIDTLNFRRFQLRPGTGNVRVKNPNKWMTICDVGSYFQQSFVKTLKSWESADITPEDIEVIREGKENRADAQFDPAMIRYNITENKALGHVMAEIHSNLRNIGIMLDKTQWIGPGQAAQQWLRQIGALTAEDYQNIVPVKARQAAQYTYYGGWFEIMHHGHWKGRAYSYDINSAYPYAIAQLPCLKHGKWLHGKGTPKRSQYTYVCAEVEGNYDATTGPLPHRNKNRRILRPIYTIGWYWLEEIEAAERAGLIGDVTILEWYSYRPCGCETPYAQIRDLYLERLKVGKETSAGKTYKLIYNSTYGKMAQSVGNPMFANGFYASLITSTTRRMILDAIATHPNGYNDVLMVATDGIVFKNPHPTLPISPTELGLWDETTIDALTLFMPGLYWDDNSRERMQLMLAMIHESERRGKRGSAIDIDLKLKSRGVSARELAPMVSTIDRQFLERESDNTLPWPKVSIGLNFNMVTPMQALRRNNWNSAGDLSEVDTKELSSNPETKRFWNGEDNTSTPYFANPNGPEYYVSRPYDKKFGDEEPDKFMEYTLDMRSILHD